MLTLVWLIRSLSISVVCLLFVVLCQIVCSECAFLVCGTDVTLSWSGSVTVSFVCQTGIASLNYSLR